MSQGGIGYYIIEGWLKTKDSIGFNAKDPEQLHTGTSRERIRAFYKRYCYRAERPDLIRVMYYHANRSPRDVTLDMKGQDPDLIDLFKKRC